MTGSQILPSKARAKWSFATIEHILKTKLVLKKPRSLESVAFKSWVIAPSEISITPPAHFLPNQLERVKNWTFASDHPAQAMAGGQVTHGATRAYLVKDVWLIDGTIYKGDARHWLAPRSRRLPQLHIENEIEHGAVICGVSGNNYFGTWLMDDCGTYIMASAEGVPITTSHAVGAHVQGYENWLNMKPARIQSAYCRELVVFDDFGQNKHKHARYRAVTEQLLSHVNTSSHPGVFILRGNTGEQRRLNNEMELAEYLQNRRGFRILDPKKTDVPTIVAMCAGAKVVIGIEGSQLAHGARVLRPGSSILTLQPPDRFVRIYKDRADCNYLHFGFVVGQSEGKNFRIDEEEVERTLDLLPD